MKTGGRTTILVASIAAVALIGMGWTYYHLSSRRASGATSQSSAPASTTLPKAEDVPTSGTGTASQKALVTDLPSEPSEKGFKFQIWLDAKNFPSSKK